MQIAQGDEIRPEPAVRHRGGSLRARILLEGTPGSADNFQLSLGSTDADFVSPRHRHNFEQYRAVITGRYDFGADGAMSEGMVGYFPEGVHYGPQSSADGTLAAVLQFGGPSRCGYLSAAEVDAGRQSLERLGEFREGVFRRRAGVAGRKNQDAFEAIWEFVNERALEYPASPYDAPTLVDPAAMSWQPLAGMPGVAEKRLGAFPANDTSMRLVRVDADASFDAAGRGIFLVCSGAGTVADVPVRRWTALHLEAGEQATIAARERCQLIHFELPTLADSAAR